MKNRKHTGFWINVGGWPVHVLGDPNMPKETLDALANMAQAVMKEVGERPPAESVTLRDPVTKDERVFSANEVKVIELWKSMGYVEVEEES